MKLPKFDGRREAWPQCSIWPRRRDVSALIPQRQPHGPEAGRAGEIEVLIVIAFPRPVNSPLIEGNVLYRAVACGQNSLAQFPLTVATELNGRVAEFTQRQNFERASKEFIDRHRRSH